MLLDLNPQTINMFQAYLAQHNLLGSSKIAAEYYSAEEQHAVPAGGNQSFFATLAEPLPTAVNPTPPTWLYYGYFDVVVSAFAAMANFALTVYAITPNFQGTVLQQLWYTNPNNTWAAGTNANFAVRISPSVPVMLSYFLINQNNTVANAAAVDFKFHGYRLRSA